MHFILHISQSESPSTFIFIPMLVFHDHAASLDLHSFAVSCYGLPTNHSFLFSFFHCCVSSVTTMCCLSFLRFLSHGCHFPILSHFSFRCCFPSRSWIFPLPLVTSLSLYRLFLHAIVLLLLLSPFSIFPPSLCVFFFAAANGFSLSLLARFPFLVL